MTTHNTSAGTVECAGALCSYCGYRPSPLDIMKQIAEVVSKRATCPRLHTASVVFDETTWRLVSTGYNGSPYGLPHCIEIGCLLEYNHCIRTVHAEMNALLHCARFGISTRGLSMLTLHRACTRCATAIIQAGISKLYCVESYFSDDSTTALNVLFNAGVSVIQYDERYNNARFPSHDLHSIP